MKILFEKNAWEDYLYWNQQNKKMFNRLNELIKQTARNPFEGIGKPERLKYLSDFYWSRRLDREHRMVYKVEGETLIIAQCRYHY